MSSRLVWATGRDTLSEKKTKQTKETVKQTLLLGNFLWLILRLDQSVESGFEGKVDIE